MPPEIDEQELADFLASFGGDQPSEGAPPSLAVTDDQVSLPDPSVDGGYSPEPAYTGPPMPPVTEFGMDRSFGPSGYQPYAIPEMRDDSGGRRMEGALGMVRDLFGVTAEGGKAGTAGGAYRDDWERQRHNADRNFDDTVVDYGRTGIDTSGMDRGGLPVQRVYALSGKELAAEPFRNFGDLRSVPGSITRRDANGEPVMGDDGRFQRYDLPGYNGMQRFGGGLREDRLENGARVFYDPFNNLTFGNRDGRPDRLLPGGIGYQGGASGGAYGLNPTTLNGRDVFYDEQGNRTFERRGDLTGRQLTGPAAQRPAGPTGSGGSGGGTWDGVYRNIGNAQRPMYTVNDEDTATMTNNPINVHTYGNYVLFEKSPGVFDIKDKAGNLIEANVPQSRIQPNIPPVKPQLGPTDKIVAGKLDQPGNVADITSGNGMVMPYRYNADGSLDPYGNARPYSAPASGVVTPPAGWTIIGKNSADDTITIQQNGTGAKQTIPAAPFRK